MYLDNRIKKKQWKKTIDEKKIAQSLYFNCDIRKLADTFRMKKVHWLVLNNSAGQQCPGDPLSRERFLIFLAGRDLRIMAFSSCRLLAEPAHRQSSSARLFALPSICAARQTLRVPHRNYLGDKLQIMYLPNSSYLSKKNSPEPLTYKRIVQLQIQTV